MLKKIYAELVLIRKELQAIRRSKESNHEVSIDGKEIAKIVQKANRDTALKALNSCRS